MLPRNPLDLPAPVVPLSGNLEALHLRLLASMPALDRIACALYESATGMLKTVLITLRSGEAVAGHEFRLADNPALSELARTGEYRVLDDIQTSLLAHPAHARWVHDRGYRSSFSVPMYGGGALVGFVFFDSTTPAAFDQRTQRDLVLYSSLINMAVANERSAVRSLVATARVARDFAGLRDFETGAHLERMARFARLIAHTIAPARGLDDEFVEQLFQFAPLHDIGKIGIPDHILLKPGKLDPDERAIIQTHVALGVEIIRKIVGDLELAALPDSKVMRNIVAHHHEMLDGSGYPRGLAGDAVPIEARIIAVADIFDALTCRRPYKPSWPLAEALAELRRMVEAGKLDRDCVEALATQGEAINAILWLISPG